MILRSEAQGSVSEVAAAVAITCLHRRTRDQQAPYSSAVVTKAGLTKKVCDLDFPSGNSTLSMFHAFPLEPGPRGTLCAQLPDMTPVSPTRPLARRARSTLYAAAFATLALASFTLASLAGCGSNVGSNGDCESGKCDDKAPTLAERNDPVATYLKTLEISDEGLMVSSYQDILFGVADVMGCSTDSIAVFTVSDTLIDAQPFPRLVSVACKDDDSKASDFFIAASFQDVDTGDVDVLDVEMFAWDKVAREYMFYAFTPDEDEMVRLEVGPKRCEGCHLTPADTSTVGMRMTPIMNELNRPWTHWNAEPGFPSHQFVVPDNMDEQPNYFGLALARQAPAQRLEEIIRFGGHSKVASARIRDRRNAPNIDEIMGMLRPVFCNEQVNYVSEDHDSGILFNSALVDPGIRSMYVQIRPNDWAWDWLNDEVVRIGSPEGDTTVVQIPVRGNSDVAMETSLVTTKVLTPYQVLRARALDSSHPVFSEFRCNLWRDAYADFKVSPPSYGDATRSMHVMSEIFERIMTVDGNPIAGSNPETIIMMPNADTTSVTRLRNAASEGALEDGSCESDGFCAGDVDALGARLEQSVQATLSSQTRDTLRAIRNERICHLLDNVPGVEGDERFPDGSIRFPNVPSLPGLDCGAVAN